MLGGDHLQARIPTLVAPRPHFYEGKCVRRLRRCGTCIQESGLPLARQREKRCATMRTNNNRLWTNGRGSTKEATDGATEKIIDGLRGKVGRSMEVFEADRVTAWEEA
jgi:hypothetical protein